MQKWYSVLGGLASQAMAVSENGIWTGHDWIDTVKGIQNSNGDLSGLNDSMIQKLKSASIYNGNDLD